MIEAFLQAVLNDPLDEVHRWVFADWLEEHGDNRANGLRQARIKCSEMRPDGFDSRTDKNIRMLDRGSSVPHVLSIPMYGDGERGLYGASLLYCVRFHESVLAKLSASSWVESAKNEELTFAVVLGQDNVTGQRDLFGFPLGALHVVCDSVYEVEFQVRLFENQQAARNAAPRMDNLWFPSARDNGFGFFCKGVLRDPLTAARKMLEELFPLHSELIQGYEPNLTRST